MPALLPLCVVPLMTCAAIGAQTGLPAPPPAALLPEAEYVKRLDIAMDGIDLPVLDRSHPPIRGMEVTQIEPGTQGEALGVVVGERMIDVDGVAVDTIPGYHAARHRHSAQKVTMWNRETGRRVVDLAAGHEGIWIKPVEPHVEAAYLASAGRSPAWDAAMVAACLTFHEDPALALTALAHAYASGYRGHFLRPLQAGALAALRRYAESSTAGEADLDGARTAEGVHGLRTLYGAALVDGRLADAQGVLARFPDLGGPPAAAAPYIAALAARRAPLEDPLTAYAAAAHIDLTGMMRCSRTSDDAGFEDMTKTLVDVRDHLDFIDCTSPVDHCFWFEIAMPTVDAVACELEFTADFANTFSAEQHVNLSIGDPHALQALDDDFRLYAMDYTLRLDHRHDALVYLRGLPPGTVPIPRPAGLENTFTVRLARKGGLVAWSLDGQRFGCQPILGQEGPKSLYVYSTGCHFHLRAMDLECFDAQPPKGWTAVVRKKAQPAVAPFVPDPKGAAGF
jgi:hypothetical protein